ncbi:MAG: hypothetical protein WD652_03315 [Acidimicrobiia bacterium]
MPGGLIFAALSVAMAVAFAVGASRFTRRRAETAALDLGGIAGRVVFFADEACKRCPAARDALVASGVEFEEIRYGDDPQRFRATGATAVPLVVVRDPRGAELGRIAGELHPRALRALLEGAGIQEGGA